MFIENYHPKTRIKNSPPSWTASLLHIHPHMCNVHVPTNCPTNRHQFTHNPMSNPHINSSLPAARWRICPQQLPRVFRPCLRRPHFVGFPFAKASSGGGG